MQQRGQRRPPAGGGERGDGDERARRDRGELLVAGRGQDLRRRRAQPLALADAVDEADRAAGLVAQQERARPDAQRLRRAVRPRRAGAARSAGSAPGRAGRPPAARARRPASAGRSTSRRRRSRRGWRRASASGRRRARCPRRGESAARPISAAASRAAAVSSLRRVGAAFGSRLRSVPAKVTTAGATFGAPAPAS